MLLILLACTEPAVADFGPSDETPDESAAPSESKPESEAPVDTGPFPTAVASAEPQAGSPTLAVSFSAEGSTSPTATLQGRWDFGDGSSAEGLDASHDYTQAGTWTATLTVDDGEGHESSATVPIYVRSPDCPTTGESVREGELQDTELHEVSGLMPSRLNPGILWVHNDAGNDPVLYALDSSGVMRARYEINVASGDWEDLGLMQLEGTWHLVVGVIGDNGRSKESIQVHLVEEPPVGATQDRVEGSLDATTLDLSYPDEARDAESLFVDPATNDIYIVTKAWDGASTLVRKSAPHEAGSTELEMLYAMDFGAPPLDGKATTAADISPDGSRILVRTYQQAGWLWERAEGQSIPEAMQGIPCEVTLPLEPQAETVAFSTDGSALWTISERELVPIYRTPFD